MGHDRHSNEAQEGKTRMKKPLTGRWLWWGPAFAVVGLLVLFSLLIALIYRDTQDERRDGLIQDILWLEQTLRLHFQSHQDWAAAIAQDLARDNINAVHFKSAARLLLRENRELVQVDYLDPKHQLIWHVSRVSDEVTANDSASEFAQQDALDSGRKMRGAAYSILYSPIHKRPLVDMVMPMYRHGEYAGAVRLTYALNGLLYHHVPWWIAQKYQISIVNLDGAVLASKFNIGERAAALSHEIDFTPPGHGLRLRATAYRVGLGLSLPLLGGGMLLSLVFLLLSLWRVRQHIRHRQQVEAHLRAEMELRAAIEDTMQNGLLVLDEQGRIVRVNRALGDMLGYSQTELIGDAPPYRFVHPEQYPAWHSALNAIQTGEVPKFGFELRCQHRQGEALDIRLYAAPLPPQSGGRGVWLASCYDITELKRKREAIQLAHSRLENTARLVALGEMASSLAHELNQPLAAITTYSKGSLRLLEQADGHTKLREPLEKMVAQSQRAADMIRGIRGFVKKRTPRLQLSEPARVIQSALTLTHSLLTERKVQVDTRLDAVPALEMDPVLIEQVLVNLLRNAIDAVSATQQPERRVHVASYVEADHWRVEVADNGPGLSTEARQQLFTPFFTSKEEGMGMGLNICRSIIEHHRGQFALYDLDCPPTCGLGGACFYFTLPLQANTTEPCQSTATAC